MIGITVNSTVFLLNTHNTGVQAGRRELMYHVTVSLAPPGTFILCHMLNVCKGFRHQGNQILPLPFYIS